MNENSLSENDIIGVENKQEYSDDDESIDELRRRWSSSKRTQISSMLGCVKR